jgi:N-acyl-L-homoserine lactone synthetase
MSARALPASAPPDRTLALLDRIARRVLERASPLRFATATTEEERLAAYRLRHATVVERGWAAADALPGGVERDHHDDEAVQILGWDGGTAIATTRVVLPAPGRPLPTEEAFGISVKPAGLVVDVGRFAVDRRYGDAAHATFAALLGAAWLESRARGHHRMCGAFTPGMIALFRRMGFRVEALGPPGPYWGEERLPILVDVVASKDNLCSRWESGAR